MNKRFVVEKHGEVGYCIIRQTPHDPQYVIGSTIPGFGTVIGYGDIASHRSSERRWKGVKGVDRRDLTEVWQTW
jgi:hypothetical protein